MISVKEDYELVFADNNSTDQTLTYINSLIVNHHKYGHMKEVKLVKLENAGFAKAVNAGIEASSSDTPIIMNNDIMVPATQMWYQDLIRAVNSGFTLSCSTTNYCGYPLQYFTDEYCIKPSFLPITECNFICICLDKKFWRENKLDENYISGVEDLDYCQTIMYKGGKIILPLSSFVYHKGSVTNKREFGEEKMKSNLYKGWLHYYDKWSKILDKKIVLDRVRQYFGENWNREDSK